MIDLIHRQTLTDQIDTARALLDQISAHARCMEIMAQRPEWREAAIYSGVEVARLAIELTDFANDLCDTASNFDLVVLLDAHRQTVSKAISELWPWLPETDSVGGPWVWDRADAIERGYCDPGEQGDDCLIGVVGFEDAVYLFDETSQPCMYARLEELQAELDRRDAKLFLEPYYSFLWTIRHEPGRSICKPGAEEVYDDALPF